MPIKTHKVLVINKMAEGVGLPALRFGQASLARVARLM
jgi:hypothetical protein